MANISEREFARLCAGIIEDRESIYRHNPIGTEEETLLWMLMSCLISYLSLSDAEIPCFPGVPTAETYRQAIRYMVMEKKTEEFDVDRYLSEFAGAA